MSVQDVSDNISSAFNETVKAVSNVGSLGLIEYSPATGGIKKGYMTQGIDETFGELTGRNMMRESLNFQREQLRKQEAEMMKLAGDERARRYQRDIQASQMAGSLRDRLVRRAAQSLGMSSSDIFGA